MGVLHGTIGIAAGLAAALVGASLAVRRLSWRLMSVLAVAAAVLQVASAQVAYFADPAYAVLFFTLGAHRSRGARRWGLACAGIATLVAGAFLAAQPRASGSVASTVALSAGFAAPTPVVWGGGGGAGVVRRPNRPGGAAR